MPRFLFALAAGCAVAAGALAADSPLAAAKAEFDMRVKEKEAAIQKATNPLDQKELFEELREYRAIEMDNLFELAEKEPTSAAAFDVFAVIMFGGIDKEKTKKAREFVEKDHLDKPHVKGVLLTLAMTGKEGDYLLLKVVADKNPDKSCQGIATYALGLASRGRMKTVGDADKPREVKNATDFFQKAVDKYADVKLEADPLGELAKGQLTALKLMDQLQVGKPLPELGGEDLDGQPYTVNDLKGKVVMISFWATWCPPCMRMIPHERDLVEKLKDKPFALVGVNGDKMDGDQLPEKVRTIIADNKITWRSLKDKQPKQMAFSQMWDIEGWPTIYLVDHKGVIRHKWTGSPGASVVDEAIEKLVAAAEKK